MSGKKRGRKKSLALEGTDHRNSLGCKICLSELLLLWPVVKEDSVLKENKKVICNVSLCGY